MNIKNIVLVILASILSIGQVVASTPPLQRSAGAILSDLAKKLEKSSGTQVEFRYRTSQTDEAGTMYMRDGKYAIVTPSFTTIYNGTDMWSADSESKEVNVVTPSDDEMREANPLQVIIDAQRQYNASRSAGSNNLTLLTLKSKDSDATFKTVKVWLNESTNELKRVELLTDEGTVAVLYINSMKFNQNLPSGHFVFKADKFPKYKIIDLR